MAFEREDVKTTLIIIKDGGKYRLSGTTRNTDSEGTTMMRITTQNLLSQEFDDVQIIDKPSTGDGDIGLTHFDVDWSDTTVF